MIYLLTSFIVQKIKKKKILVWIQSYNDISFSEKIFFRKTINIQFFCIT